MEKTCCQVNVVETEGGYRAEVRGDKDRLRQAWTGCCDEKQGGGDCCRGDVAVKRDCCEAAVHEVEGGFDVSYRGDKEVLRGWLQRVCGACCSQ